MGHIVVMDDSEAQFALTRYSRDLWHDMAAEPAAEVEFERCGTLWVAADEEEMDEVRRKRRSTAARGVRRDIARRRRRWPRRSRICARAWPADCWCPTTSCIYAPCAAHWLLERGRQRGSLCRDGLRRTLGRMACGSADGSRISAGVTVCAAGTWTRALARACTSARARAISPSPTATPASCGISSSNSGYLKSAHGIGAESVAFNVQPRTTGQVLIGSSRQFGITAIRNVELK